MSMGDFATENVESLQAGAKERSTVILDCYNEPILATKEELSEDCQGNSEQMVCFDEDDGNASIDEARFVVDNRTTSRQIKHSDCTEETELTDQIKNENRPIGSRGNDHVGEFEPIYAGEESHGEESVSVDESEKNGEDEKSNAGSSSFFIFVEPSENEETSEKSRNALIPGENSDKHLQLTANTLGSKVSHDSLRSVTSPIQAEDLTDGLNLNLELHDDIMKAINNLDDFILSEDEDNEEEET